MSTITTISDKNSPVEYLKTVIVKDEVVVDFSKVAAVSGDIVQVLTIPANSVVIKTGVKVLTAETGTISVGLGAGTEFDTSVNVGVTGCTIGDGSGATGTYFAAEDTIDVALLSADLDSGKISVWAIFAQLEN